MLDQLLLKLNCGYIGREFKDKDIVKKFVLNSIFVLIRWDNFENLVKGRSRKKLWWSHSAELKFSRISFY